MRCGCPFAADSFAGVMANHMLYHVADQHGAVAEVRRVLAPGGAFVAVTNAIDHFAELTPAAGRGDGTATAGAGLASGSAPITAVSCSRPTSTRSCCTSTATSWSCPSPARSSATSAARVT